MGRWLSATALAVLLAPAAIVLSGSPASAVACAKGEGVTVVVQGFGMNGTSCVNSSGMTAQSAFQAAGYSLRDVPRQPGAVCQINGKPQNMNECFEVDSYWGLYHANGKGGGWVYSSTGVRSLNISKGGWVAFVFQNSSARKSPSVTPIGPAPPPPPPPPTKSPVNPSPKPSKSPKKPGDASASPDSKKPGQSESNGASSKDGKGAKDGSAKGSASGQGDSEITESAPNDSALDENTSTLANQEQSSGSRLWTIVGVVLIIAAGVALVIRNRRAGQS